MILLYKLVRTVYDRCNGGIVVVAEQTDSRVCATARRANLLTLGSVRLLTAPFGQFTQKTLERKAKLNNSVRKLRNAQLTSAFASWREFVAWKEVSRQQMSAVISLLSKRLTVLAFSFWKVHSPPVLYAKREALLYSSSACPNSPRLCAASSRLCCCLSRPLWNCQHKTRID